MTAEVYGQLASRARTGLPERPVTSSVRLWRCSRATTGASLAQRAQRKEDLTPFLGHLLFTGIDVEQPLTELSLSLFLSAYLTPPTESPGESEPKKGSSRQAAHGSY